MFENIKKLIYTFSLKLKTVLNQKRLTASLLVIALLLILFKSITVYVDNKSHRYNNFSNSRINNSLEQVLVGVDAINSTSNSEKLKMQGLENIVVSIKNNLNDLVKLEDLNRLSKNLTKKNDLFLEKIHVETELLKHLNSNKTHYLDQSELPFKVVSIDIMGNEPYISIDYNNHIDSYILNDLLAGWTLMDVDYGPLECRSKTGKIY